MMDKSPADQTDLAWNEALYGAFSDGYAEGHKDGLELILNAITTTLQGLKPVAPETDKQKDGS